MGMRILNGPEAVRLPVEIELEDIPAPGGGQRLTLLVGGLRVQPAEHTAIFIHPADVDRPLEWKVQTLFRNWVQVLLATPRG